MPMYDKMELAEQAKELHVVRDTLEKVYRLRDILHFFDEAGLLRDNLALKGGTAINLLFFNLPRLSVDIDLDFSWDTSRQEMLSTRERIGDVLDKYMTAEGYALSPKSKTPHSLDSFVYDYINAAGMKDNIKVEINYSLRAHVFPAERLKVKADIPQSDFMVTTICPAEIYASKTVALMTRAAARDLYDLNYMVKHGLLDAEQTEAYRKCVIFYLAVATKNTPLKLDFTSIDSITPHKILTDLVPVVRDRDAFELDDAKATVRDYLKQTLYLCGSEYEFLYKFKKGYYRPELLFDKTDVLERIQAHPMALWKTARNRDGQER